MTARREIIMERQGVTITGIRRRWWERTYAIPRWIVWVYIVLSFGQLPFAVYRMMEWLS